MDNHFYSTDGKDFVTKDLRDIYERLRAMTDDLDKTIKDSAQRVAALS